MNRQAWVGAAVILVAGWLPTACAQQSVWRAAAHLPKPATPAKQKATLSADVVLGKPIAIPRCSSATLEVEPSSSEPPLLRPGQIIAASAQSPPLVESKESEQPEILFAMDRPTKAEPGNLKPIAAVTSAEDWSSSRTSADSPPLTESKVIALAPCESTSNGFYLTGEYLLWRTKADHAPALVTTDSPQAGISAGSLASPSATVLFGGGLDHDLRSGGRFFAGYAFDDCRDTGLEIGGFFLGERSGHFGVNSDLDPVLTRPITNINQNTPTAVRIAFPQVSNGSIQIDGTSDFWGLEGNVKWKAWGSGEYQAVLLAGMRFMSLRDRLSIVDNFQGLSAAPDPYRNATVYGLDRFATRNEFYGGQIGAEARWQKGPWVIDLRGKFAAGMTTEEIAIEGVQSITNPSHAVSSLPGNLLALGTNIGVQARDRFAVVPEIGVTVGYQATENIRLFVGYNFLYWNGVVRAGEQIDTGVDVTRIPNYAASSGVVPLLGEQRPRMAYKESDFWAQGLVCGLEFVY
jgi:hypothetical protein